MVRVGGVFHQLLKLAVTLPAVVLVNWHLLYSSTHPLIRRMRMPRPAPSFDTNKFINVAQVGGIEAYTIDEGPARGVRALLVNTGGGLRYRILVDRGMDIDQAFAGPHSLSFLTHRGATPPTRAFDRDLDWLKGFPGGLLTSCGPFNIGGPGSDELGEYGLHGEHSSTAAFIESVIQP